MNSTCTDMTDHVPFILIHPKNLVLPQMGMN
jgi:hypothetical protein